MDLLKLKLKLKLRLRLTPLFVFSARGTKVLNHEDSSHPPTFVAKNQSPWESSINEVLWKSVECNHMHVLGHHCLSLLRVIARREMSAWRTLVLSHC